MQRMKITYLVVALALLAVPTAAQQDDGGLEAELRADVGQMTVEYWAPKLNEYKQRIDQMLASNDRAELDRLRVRWGLLLAASVDAEANVQSVDGDQHEMRFELQADNGEELMSVFAEVMGLSARYRSGLDELSEAVIRDLSAFASKLDERTGEFINRHRAEIAASEPASRLAEKHGELSRVAARLDSKDGRDELEMVYAFAIEPIVLLYNGADLRQLLEGAVPGGIAGVGGLELPEASALMQNYPNPASSTTTIGYRLVEASSNTVLRIYDARGAVQVTRDLGPRPAGEHEVSVDVSALPAGSYLYHLSVDTPSGPQVHSKVMKVVR